jgi:hypothetical protein
MRETSASKPPMKHRKTLDDIKTGASFLLQEEHGENLLIGHVVSGVEEA